MDTKNTRLPILSIIVPAFNASDYIYPLIASIQNQSCTDWKMLLVDDGSIDISGNTCDKYALNDDRIIAIHKLNAGQSSARNIGLELVSGDYVAFADDDDILHPKMYESMLKAMEKCHCSVCAALFENVQQDDMARVLYSEPASPVWINEKELVHNFFSPTWRIPIWNKLYRRSIINDMRFHNTKLGEDNFFSYNVIKRCRGMAYINTPLYFQRMHENNFEYTGWRYMNDLLRTKEMILSDIKIYFPYEFRNSQIQFIDECIRVYNIFCNSADKCDKQKKETMTILLRNLRGLSYMYIPLLRKLLLLPIGRRILLKTIRMIHSYKTY